MELKNKGAVPIDEYIRGLDPAPSAIGTYAFPVENSYVGVGPGDYYYVTLDQAKTFMLAAYSQAIGVPAAGTISGGPYITVKNSGYELDLKSPDGAKHTQLYTADDFSFNIGSTTNIQGQVNIQQSLSIARGPDINRITTESGGNLTIDATGHAISVTSTSNTFSGLIKTPEVTLTTAGGVDAKITGSAAGSFNVFTGGKSTRSLNISASNAFEVVSNSGTYGTIFLVNDAGYLEFYDGSTPYAPRWNLAALSANAVLSLGANKEMVTTQLTNGQIQIGSTGAAPAATTLTAGTGISITNGAGSVTIEATGGAGTDTTFTANFNTGSTAGTDDATATIKLSKVGSIVTMTIPYFTGTIVHPSGNNFNTDNSSTPAPLSASYRPASTNRLFPAFVQSNLILSDTVMGTVVVKADGNIHVGYTVNDGKFPTGLSAGIGYATMDQSFTWTTA